MPDDISDRIRANRANVWQMEIVGLLINVTGMLDKMRRTHIEYHIRDARSDGRCRTSHKNAGGNKLW